MIEVMGLVFLGLFIIHYLVTYENTYMTHASK